MGSRGDLQPYCALAIGLRRAGHQVTIATTENFESFIKQFDLEFASIGGNSQELFQSSEGIRTVAGEKVEILSDALFQQQLESAWLACRESEVIIYTPQTNWGYHIVEKLEIPCFIASCLPFSATGMFPYLNFNQIANNPLSRVINYTTYLLLEFLYWQRYKHLINRFRTQTLKLPSLSFLGTIGRNDTPKNLLKIPVLHGYSSHVIPRPNDWPEWVYLTGYWFIDQADDYTPCEELREFLRQKPTPISIGFGSMAMRNPEKVTNSILKALEKTHQRGIILSGWGNVGTTDEVKDSSRAFVINSVPHDWLLPQVLANVHHGGAGTSAAVLRAAIPSIVMPFFADQPIWAEKLAQLGVTPQPIPFKEFSEEALAAAIEIALNDSRMRSQAKELGEKIRSEDGVANAVDIIHRHLGLIE
ncbi:glycosyltransferase family 1 protein [Nostoc sp. FACHB-110]|nr:glycosyltransferase family 1 protein [Nostoc sp. FACHB-110]